MLHFFLLHSGLAVSNVCQVILKYWLKLLFQSFEPFCYKIWLLFFWPRNCILLCWCHNFIFLDVIYSNMFERSFICSFIYSNMFQRSFIWRWWKRSRNQSGGTNEGWINAKNVKTQKGIIKTNDDEKTQRFISPKNKTKSTEFNLNFWHWQIQHHFKKST